MLEFVAVQYLSRGVIRMILINKPHVQLPRLESSNMRQYLDEPAGDIGSATGCRAQERFRLELASNLTWIKVSEKETKSGLRTVHSLSCWSESQSE